MESAARIIPDNITRQPVKKDKKSESEIKKQLENMRDKDREMVRGIFRFYEVPGGGMSFCFKAYKNDPIELYDLVDGQVYTLPLGVAKHLNKNGWYPEYEHHKDEQTRNIMRIGKKVRRFGFQSLEFVDSDDLSENGTPTLFTVETVGI